MEPTADITNDLLGEFLEEATEHLAILADLLGQLEATSQAGPVSFDTPEKKELMNGMFCAAHSLKGLSAAFGFQGMNALNHAMETLFDDARMGRRKLDDRAIGALRAGQMAMHDELQEIRKPSGRIIETAAIVGQLERLIDRQPGGEPGSPSGQADPPMPSPGVRSAALDDPQGRLAFFSEVDRGLDQLAEQLLNLEQRATGALANDVVQTAHTIRDWFETAGLRAAQTVADDLEGMLTRLRDAGHQADTAMMAHLFGMTDQLQEMVASARAAHDGLPSDAAPRDAAPRPLPSRRPSARRKNPARTAGPVGSGYDITVRLAAGDPECELQARLIFNKLQAFGTVQQCTPDLNAILPAPLDTLHIVLSTTDPSGSGAARLTRVLQSFGVHDVVVRPMGPVGLRGAAPLAGAPTGGSKSTATDHGTESAARCGTPQEWPNAHPVPASHQADDPEGLTALAAELVALHAHMTRDGQRSVDRADGELCGRLDRVVASLQSAWRTGMSPVTEGTPSATVDAVLADLAAIRHALGSGGRDQSGPPARWNRAVDALGQLSAAIHRCATRTRRVSMATMLAACEALVRDTAEALGKRVDCQFEGIHADVDQRIVEELRDPLTHILRNALDHGIELPADRERSGKPASGRLAVETLQDGDTVTIRVVDDGRGIDTAAVRRRIVERAILSEAAAARLTDAEVVQYIGHPGVSAGQRVSDRSGRGMGMDIVTARVAQLNGTIAIDTVAGAGTTVTLRLPMALRTLAATVCRVGSETVAIPHHALDAVLTVHRAQRHTLLGRPVVDAGGSIVPLRDLGELLNIPECRSTGLGRAVSTVLVLRDGGRRLGVVVDRCLGQQDLVCKSLSHPRDGVSAAAVMPDGGVALIIDPGVLMEGC